MNVVEKLKQTAIITLLLIIACSSGVIQDRTVVYVTKTGEKYHTKSCRYLKYSSIEITLDKAKDRGYTPCSVCKPGMASIPNDRTDRSTLPEATAPVHRTESVTTRQCSATTKAGSRCKRMTSDASGKCWQHQ